MGIRIARVCFAAVVRVGWTDAKWKNLHWCVPMRSAGTRRATAKTPQDQTMLQRQIDATDRQIDRLVYELYGLTDAEIKIVEAANS